MVVQKRRISVSKVAQAALSFIDFRSREHEYKGLKDKSRDAITDFLVPDKDKIKPDDVHAGNPNKVRVDEEKGHRYWDFESPVDIGGKIYESVELQRRISGPFMDLDKVREFFNPNTDDVDYGGLTEEEFLRRKALYKKVYHSVSEYIWDFDVIYRLQQEGKLSEEEVEALMTVDISWSLGVKEKR